MALLSTFVYLSYIRSVDQRELDHRLAALRDPTYVFIATRDLPVGTLLAADDVERMIAPKAFTPPSIVTKLQAIVGKEISAKILVGEAISERRLHQKTPERAATAIGVGHVAIAIKIDNISGVAGGVRPGDIVDILYSDSKGDTEAFIGGVKVLGVAGTSPFNAPGDVGDQYSAQSQNTRDSVVLELRPPAAIRLTEASEKGTLRLALRAGRRSIQEVVE